uniref:Aminopeptidase YpdF (MP-, MA-, MS-, AP-, NP-specific) n=1 Tax=Loigolactobacillus rennini TaxID=238013 RepID=A0A1K2I735_9LACO|nr:Aminopeptidase YpdF (MP-, MA-, MS-, AP-, NP-specific) [Loigolactobacillus rennini]
MAQRLAALRKKLTAIQLDGLMVTNAANLRYLTHFTGTSGVALITRTSAFFVTDSRYTQQAYQQVAPQGYAIVESAGSLFAEINRLLRKLQLTTLGFEADYVSFNTYDDLADLFDVGLVPTSGIVEQLRAVKDPDEVALIREAAAITDQAYQHVLTTIHPGMTERQVADDLDFYMRRQGASGIAFDTIVASGPRSAMPHGVATDKVIAANELVTLDFGCYYHGYVSDLTRTFAVGQPSSELKHIYQIVLQAQEQVIKNARAGLTGQQFDYVARQVITKAGYGDYFGHGTGHGIGLEIHEAPLASPSASDTTLVDGNVITAEPGIYLLGLGGVRIEDDLLIMSSGNQILNNAPKHDLIVV